MSLVEFMEIFELSLYILERILNELFPYNNIEYPYWRKCIKNILEMSNLVRLDIRRFGSGIRIDPNVRIVCVSQCLHI